MDHPEILTVKQAAELLQVTPEHVRRLIRAGELPAAKLDGWRIRRDAIMEFLKSREARRGQGGENPGT